MQFVRVKNTIRLIKAVNDLQSAENDGLQFRPNKIIHDRKSTNAPVFIVPE